MADTVTQYYNMTKPEVGASQDTWGNKLNANFDIIDSAMKDNSKFKDASNIIEGILPDARLSNIAFPRNATIDGTTNINALTNPGWGGFLFGPNNPNLPVAGYYWHILVVTFGTNVRQIAFPYAWNQSVSAADAIWIRAAPGGTFGTWRKVAMDDEVAKLAGAIFTGNARAPRFIAGSAASDPNNIDTDAGLVSYSARRAIEWGYPSGVAHNYTNTLGADSSGNGHVLFGGFSADAIPKWTARGGSPAVGIRKSGTFLDFFAVPAGVDQNAFSFANINSASGDLTLSGRAYDALGLLAGCPAGMVAAFPSGSLPSGWLECAGSVVNRTSYPALWAYGSTYAVTEATWGAGYYGRFSSGNGSTTFRIPLFRGLFLRGYDNGQGFDPYGTALGAYAASMNIQHQHSGSTDATGAHQHAIGATYNGSGTSSNGGYILPSGTGAVTDFTGNHAHTFTTAISGGLEARPANVSVIWGIKAH